MSYITEIFERLDLQHIREFLLHGVECVEISDKTYKQRMEDARTPVIAKIQKKFPETDEYEEITADIYEYASTAQNVYMEIGMQCGAVLLAQLLSDLPKRTGE